MSNLEALLHDTCRRAMEPGQIFDNHLRLYRNAIALAREARLRFGGSETSAALLAEVCEHAAAMGLDPDLRLHDAMPLQRLAVQLSRAARLAERPMRAQHSMQREKAGAPQAAASLPQSPMQRETRPEPEPTCAETPQHPVQREKARAPQAEASFPQHLMQRRKPAPDADLSAWRRDHKHERDQRAHEKLRTVYDERLGAKIKAMNKRDREAGEAA